MIAKTVTIMNDEELKQITQKIYKERVTDELTWFRFLPAYFRQYYGLINNLSGFSNYYPDELKRWLDGNYFFIEGVKVKVKILPIKGFILGINMNLENVI